jgi:1,4-alpha-glucan branching enzyme
MIRHSPDGHAGAAALYVKLVMMAMLDAAVLYRPVVRDVAFRLDGRRVPGAEAVVLVASFNRWDPAAHHLTRQSDGWWTTSIPLGPGQYPYLFIVDGVPWNDPDDDGRMPSEWGLDLSVRVVR